MKKLQDLKCSYRLITTRGYPLSIKKHLLQSVLQELKILQNQCKPFQNNLQINSFVKNEKTLSTFGSPSLLSQREIFEEETIITASFLESDISSQDLEAKIIQNQRLKCYLNEQIETLEDDYFQRQKILLTKRELCQELDDEIAKKSYEITKRSCQKGALPCQDEKKSLTTRIKYLIWG